MTTEFSPVIVVVLASRRAFAIDSLPGKQNISAFLIGGYFPVFGGCSRPTCRRTLDNIFHTALLPDETYRHQLERVGRPVGPRHDLNLGMVTDAVEDQRRDDPDSACRQEYQERIQQFARIGSYFGQAGVYVGC